MGAEELSQPALHSGRAWPPISHSTSLLCHVVAPVPAASATHVGRTLLKSLLLRNLPDFGARVHDSKNLIRPDDSHYTRMCCFNKNRGYLLSTYSAPGANVIITRLSSRLDYYPLLIAEETEIRELK